MPYKKDINEDYKRFGMFLETVGVTATELCHDTGRDKSIVSKWVNGKLKPPYSILKYLHKKYNLNFNWYFEGTGQPVLKTVDKRNLLTDVNDLVATIKMLTAKQQQQDKIIKELARKLFDKG